MANCTKKGCRVEEYLKEGMIFLLLVGVLFVSRPGGMSMIEWVTFVEGVALLAVAYLAYLIRDKSHSSFIENSALIIMVATGIIGLLRIIASL